MATNKPTPSEPTLHPTLAKLDKVRRPSQSIVQSPSGTLQLMGTIEMQHRNKEGLVVIVPAGQPLTADHQPVLEVPQFQVAAPKNSSAVPPRTPAGTVKAPTTPAAPPAKLPPPAPVLSTKPLADVAAELNALQVVRDLEVYGRKDGRKEVVGMVLARIAEIQASAGAPPAGAGDAPADPTRNADGEDAVEDDGEGEGEDDDTDIDPALAGATGDDKAPKKAAAKKAAKKAGNK